MPKINQFEEKNPNWKGDLIGIDGVHAWVIKRLGRPRKCELCGTNNAKVFEWANISKKYKRDLNDWKRLCRRCHRKFDNGFGENHYCSKLTNKDILKIRNLYKANKYSQRGLAKIFDVNRKNIWKIIHNKTWQYV